MSPRASMRFSLCTALPIPAYRSRLFAWLAICLLSVIVGYQTLPAGQETDRELTIGERFHNETSFSWHGIIADLFRSNPDAPPQYKTYEGTLRTQLPSPIHRGLTVEEALQKRRSRRNYSSTPISLADLSQLLWAAQGVTGKTFEQLLRPAPSAGALYPHEIYVVAMNVDSLDPGIYHYSVRSHELELIKSGEFRKDVSGAALEQEMMGDADVTFILSAVFNRTRHKYGERGFRYIYIEAGHISQNIYLQAVSLELGSVAVGAFHDDKTNELIGVDGETEAAIYMHAVGTR